MANTKKNTRTNKNTNANKNESADDKLRADALALAANTDTLASIARFVGVSDAKTFREKVRRSVGHKSKAENGTRFIADNKEAIVDIAMRSRKVKANDA